ncbi:MAG: hypothetical protein FWB79_03120 [Treponema sp.]|nr:hypothetical protein [Treponema sp.]
MKYLSRAFFFCALFSLAMLAGHAQVDRQELERFQAPVNFVNFEGPVVRNETREQIRQIGVGLGQAVAAGQSQAGTMGWYFVINAVSPPDGDRLSADIFGIGAGAAVDHIRNVRVIIQGYLQAAYNYSEADATLLSQFVTIYNAVNRDDWNFISGRYKPLVLSHLTPQNVGISVRFDEWAGRTRMLIPLSGMGDLSAVDTAAISDPRVIDELRREDGMGIELRMDLVDLMEREAMEAEARAAALREAARLEEQALAEERARLAAEQQRIAQAQAAGEPTQAAAATAAAQEQALAEREAALAAGQAEAERQAQFAEQRFDDAQQHREAIAQDQQQIIVAQAGLPPQLPPALRQGFLTVVIERPGSTMGRLVSIDPATRQQRNSPLTTVQARTPTFVEGRLLAIAGERVGQGAVRLVEIDTRSLEMVSQGEDDIHPGSLIWQNGAYLYAITADHANGGALNLGRFDRNLVMQARSEVTLHPNASISIQQGSLLTQRADGTAAVLHPTSLAEN